MLVRQAQARQGYKNDMGSPIIFLTLAVVAVLAALGMLLSRNAIHSALFLVLNFATVAVLYLVLNAPFIAMVQVTVYAGAIIVLFLFVIMLLGAERLTGVAGGGRGQRVLAVILAIVLLAVFASVLLQGSAPTASAALSAIASGPAELGLRLFEAYVVPFEATGVLLLAAMIGIFALSISERRGSDAGSNN